MVGDLLALPGGAVEGAAGHLALDSLGLLPVAALGGEGPARLVAEGGHEVAHLLDLHPEELLAGVHLVHLLVDEAALEVALEGGGVVAADEGVDVEVERHAGVAELADAASGSSRRVRPIL